ncbi:MAG TPA: hypothetical protein VN026_10220 [Bacteroidia bacterium]|jgi:hypothetical protein|nr:hypothetical protein [Bacteroidia bacterium]
MIKFLPKNLDLKQILLDNPPEFKYHIDHFVYLCSLLYELPAKKKGMLLKNGFVPLHAHLLKKVNNNYKRYFNYLIKYGVIECDNHYIVGKKSRCYRFAPKYHDIIQPIYITKYTLTKNLKEVHRFNRNMYAKYNYLHKWFNDGLCIDFDSAEQKLVELYQHDLDVREVNALHKLNVNLVNLIKLDKKDYYFTVDSTSGRLHTLLTKLKRELRPYITYENNHLGNIDIRCSQPTLSLCLLEPSFYNAELKQERVNINSVAPELIKHLPTQTIASYVQTHQNQFQAYRELVLNDFYIGMSKILSDHSLDIPYDRDAIKDMMFMVLYSSNKFINGPQALPKRIFKRSFEAVYEVFKMYKSAGQANLPILLQTIEARLILDKTAKVISKTEPGMALYTIQDSIVCPVEKIELCKQILLNESVKYLGFEPKLKIDLWDKPTENSVSQVQNSIQ